MPLNEKEALELLQFLNLNEAENLEAAKEKFEQTYVESKELSGHLSRLALH